MSRALLKDVSIEGIVIGRALSDSSETHIVLESLSPEDFSDLGNRRFFEALQKAKSPSQALVSHELETIDPSIDADMVWFEMINKGLDDFAPVSEHIAKIKGMSHRRSLMDSLAHVAKMVHDPSLDPDSLRDLASKEIRGDMKGYISSDTRHQSVVVDEVMDRAHAGQRDEGDKGVSWGYDALDVLVKPKVGDLVVIPATSGMGKTTLLALLAKTASSDRPVLFAQMEQPDVDIVTRLFCEATGATFKDVAQGKMSDAMWQLFYQVADTLKKCDIYWQNAHSIDSAIERAWDIYYKTGKMPYLIVDYLELLMDDSSSNVNQVAKAEVKKLKGFAMNPVEKTVAYLACQFSKKVDDAEDKRPQTSYINGSKSIVYLADVILSPHRPERWDEYEDPTVLECHVLKNKNGGFMIEIEDGGFERPHLYCDLRQFVIRDETYAEAQDRRNGVPRAGKGHAQSERGKKEQEFWDGI